MVQPRDSPDVSRPEDALAVFGGSLGCRVGGENIVNA